MNHLKEKPLIYATVVCLLLALSLVSFSGFKSAEETKSVMTIDLWLYGPPKDNTGLYVFQDGKLLEFIYSGNEAHPNDVLARGEIFNKRLTKYYSEGWRVVSTDSYGNGGYVRYILER
jgi:hypothetical protein